MFVDVYFVMYTEKKIKDFSSFCFFWHTPLFPLLLFLRVTSAQTRGSHVKKHADRNGLRKITWLCFVCICVCMGLRGVCSSCPNRCPLAYKHTQNRTVNQDLVSVWIYCFHVISIAVRCQLSVPRLCSLTSETDVWAKRRCDPWCSDRKSASSHGLA